MGKVKKKIAETFYFAATLGSVFGLWKPEPAYALQSLPKAFHASIAIDPFGLLQT